MNLSHLCVVLVEPQGALNIGSVARAMGNFGIRDLRLVNPQVDHLGSEAYRMAVKGAPILEAARLYPDLLRAISDCRLAMGTTRRTGKYREEFLFADQAAQLAATLSLEGRLALVFGREDRGLHTEELDLCQRFITIATDDAVPSMNLAQSVSVCLYEMYKAAQSLRSADLRSRPFAGVQELEGLFSHMRKTLLDIDYLDPQNPEHILRSFRRILSRAQLDEREVRILHGMLSRMDWVEGQRQILKERLDAACPD